MPTADRPFPQEGMIRTTEGGFSDIGGRGRGHGCLAIARRSAAGHRKNAAHRAHWNHVECSDPKPGDVLTRIASKVGRWPTFALAILAGLVVIAIGIGVFLITIGSWGGGDYLLPVSVLSLVLMATGVGLMLRAGWWVDRTG
jgi:hypothetical protein